jgi:hypothetical protein
MLWKKKGNLTKEKLPNHQEVLRNKRETLKKQIIEEVESLTNGQTIIYQLSEFYSFARFLGVELNPAFPQKGKKYRMFSDEMAGGMPAGKKSYMDSTNNASGFAEWVADKDSDQYGHVKRFQ